MSLNSLVNTIPDVAYKQITVSLEEFGIQGEGITFKEPSVSELYTVHADLEQYLKKADIAADAAFNVAFLALCHVSPEIEPNSESAGELYLKLATMKDPLIFLKLTGVFRREFPWINAWLGSVASKNDSSAE